MGELGNVGAAGEVRRHAVKKRSGAALFVAFLLALGAGALWLWRQGGLTPVAAPASTPLAAPAPVAAPQAPEVDAPVAASPLSGEALLRKLGAQLSSSPDLAKWLAQASIIQRLTAAVNLVAGGESPRPVLGFLAPTKEFAVVERDGKIYTAPADYERYESFARVVTGIEPTRAAHVYGELAPYFRAAFREIGRPGQKFDAVLGTAISNLLATPIPADEPELVAKGAQYAYADPTLEALSPAQKQLLRLGPVHVRVLQNWLRSFQGALGH